jgi:ribosomal protein L35AE/L33A
MKARILQYRRSRHHVRPRHYLLEVDGVDSRAKAQKLVGKRVTWKSSGGAKIVGRVAAPHGGKGVVRAILERGLPGQALGTPATVE